MTHMIPIARPVLGEEEIAAAARCIQSGWLTQGPEVAAFEQEFAAVVGAAHACAVSNCTTALHLALQVLGVCAGDDVITASHSFIATANAIRYLGARPVFVDIAPPGFNLDPAQVEAAITERTRAILCVHQLGMPCDLEAIVEIGRRYGIPIVEDAACAIGSEVRWDGVWERIGKPHGDIACFSFHPRKVITTGDGGMITTNNAVWDRACRLLRQHGMSVADTVRHGSRRVIQESYDVLGYNYRLTDLQAAVGRAQLRRLPELIRERRALADRYRTLLEGIPGLGLPVEPTWARSNWQSYPVRLPPGCDQRSVMQAMLDRGVATRRGVMCAHRQPAYPAGTWAAGPAFAPSFAAGPPPPAALRHSEEAEDTVLLLPFYNGLPAADQQRAAATLADVCGAALAVGCQPVEL